MDFILPDISGNEVCQLLKQRDDTKAIPIIALSIKSSTEDKIAGLLAGADDYLPKPYSEEELLARIYAMLRTKELQDELRKKNRELTEVLSKMEVIARTDPMTGLFNRRHFDTLLEKEFNKTLRYQFPAACMVIDVDGFKSINDKHGHHVGDVCLKETADVIRNCVRKIDTVARWGGEEFIVLLPETKKGTAMSVAARIVAAISSNKCSGISKQITVSIGIAGVPDPSIANAEKLVNAADNAMYEAKTKGGNGIEVA
jgi:two-component system cell cycle response regulator